MKKNSADIYNLIDMFNQLDTSFLDELHLERDLRRKKRVWRRFFVNSYVKTATMLAGIGILITGFLGFYFYISDKKGKLRNI